VSILFEVQEPLNKVESLHRLSCAAQKGKEYILDAFHYFDIETVLGAAELAVDLELASDVVIDLEAQFAQESGPEEPVFDE